MSISNEEREKQITIPSHHLLLFTLTKHSTWPINFWEAHSVVVKWCFFGRNTLFAATADGKQPPCEFHWKAILSFSTPFQFELRGWAKENTGITKTCLLTNHYLRPSLYSILTKTFEGTLLTLKPQRHLTPEGARSGKHPLQCIQSSY